MNYYKFICPPPGCSGIFPQQSSPIDPIGCCFSVESGLGDSIILERDNVPVACVMECPPPTGCYIACVTPTGPSWTPIPLIVNDDVIDVDSGIPTTFNVLNNDVGVGLTLTQINGVDVSTGDIITLPSDATLAVLENGNINYLTCSMDTTDSFTYQATDLFGNSDTASVTVNIMQILLNPGTPYQGAGASTQLFRFEWNPNTDMLDNIAVGIPQNNYNAMGYNPQDGLIYAVVTNLPTGFPRVLISIDSNTGDIVNPNILEVSPVSSEIAVGDFDTTNNMFVVVTLGLSPQAVYVIDFNGPLTLSTGSKINPVAIADIAYNPITDSFWAAETNTGDIYELTIDYNTNNLTYTQVTMGGSIASAFGASFGDSLGNIVVLANDTGDMYTWNSPANGVANNFRLIGQSVVAQQNDGAQNSTVPGYFSYPYIALSTSPGADCFYIATYTGAPVYVADTTTSVIGLFTPENILSEMNIILTNYFPGDAFILSGSLPPGLASTIMVVGNELRLRIFGNANPVDYLAALNLVQFDTTSNNITPRLIQTTLTTTEDLTSFTPSRTVVYIS